MQLSLVEICESDLCNKVCWDICFRKCSCGSQLSRAIVYTPVKIPANCNSLWFAFLYTPGLEVFSSSIFVFIFILEAFSPPVLAILLHPNPEPGLLRRIVLFIPPWQGECPSQIPAGLWLNPGSSPACTLILLVPAVSSSKWRKLIFHWRHWRIKPKLRCTGALRFRHEFPRRCFKAFANKCARTGTNVGKDSACAERENPTVPGLWAALELCLLHCFAVRLVCQLNRDAMCQTCCGQELCCLLEFWDCE